MAVNAHQYPPTADLIDLLRQNPDVIVTVYPDEESWLAARAKLFTASDASMLGNKNNFKGLLRGWYIKAGLLDDSLAKYQTAAKAGHYWELAAAAWYADETGRVVEDPGDYCIITNRKYPGIGATLDRLQWDAVRGLGVLELKNPDRFMRDEWIDGNLPDHVRWQVQVQMLVCGLPWACVAYFIGGNDPYWTHVDAHPRFQAQVVRRIAGFMSSVRRGEPPEPTGHDTDNQTYADLYPEDKGITIDLGAELRDVYDEMCEVSKTKGEADKRYKQLQAKVRQVMGPASVALGTGYQFKISRNAKDASYQVTPRSLAEAIKVQTALEELGVDYKVTGGHVESRLTKAKGK